MVTIKKRMVNAPCFMESHMNMNCPSAVIRKLEVALVVFAMVGLPSLSFAESETAAADPPPAPWKGDIWTRERLTGDWGGLRTDLHDHGIDIGLRQSHYGQWVSSGGVRKNGEYGATIDYRAHIDGKKLFGTWEGLSIDIHARTRYGQDVNADAGDLVLQNTGLLMPGTGNYHGTDVTGLTLTQMFPFFGKPAMINGGILDVLDLVTGFFPNVGYGQEGFMNVNSMVSALPWVGAVRGLSLYGGWVTTINPEHKSPETGFLVTGTENESQSLGSVSDAFDKGVWLAGFHRFFWKLGDKRDKPGYLMVFAGGSTENQKSNEPSDIVIVPGLGLVNTQQAKKPWDVALYLYQEFGHAAGNPDRKTTIMLGGTVGPGNPQFAQFNVFANLETFGLMKSRPHDRMGVAGWGNLLSDNFKKLVSPVINLRDLWGVEVYYSVQIIPSVHLTADLQFVQNARNGDNIAVIPAVRLVTDF
jgi:porin